MSLSAWAAITNTKDWVAWATEIYFLTILDSWKSEINVQKSLAYSEVSLSDLQAAF